MTDPSSIYQIGDADYQEYANLRIRHYGCDEFEIENELEIPIGIFNVSVQKSSNFERIGFKLIQKKSIIFSASVYNITSFRRYNTSTIIIYRYILHKHENIDDIYSRFHHYFFSDTSGSFMDIDFYDTYLSLSIPIHDKNIITTLPKSIFYFE